MGKKLLDYLMSLSLWQPFPACGHRMLPLFQAFEEMPRTTFSFCARVKMSASCVKLNFLVNCFKRIVSKRKGR